MLLLQHIKCQTNLSTSKGALKCILWAEKLSQNRLYPEMFSHKFWSFTYFLSHAIIVLHDYAFIYDVLFSLCSANSDLLDKYEKAESE